MNNEPKQIDVEILKKCVLNSIKREDMAKDLKCQLAHFLGDYQRLKRKLRKLKKKQRKFISKSYLTYLVKLYGKRKT